MANIRGLVRRQLPSQAVGTLGVDLSTAQGFESLARSTASIANKFKQNEQITNRVDALKAAQDITLAANSKVAVQQGIANKNSQISTKESMNVQTQFFDKTVEDSLLNIKDKNIRRLTKLQLAQNRTSALNSIASWGIKRQSVKALESGTVGINKLSRAARQVTTLDELFAPGGIVEQSQQLGSVTAAVLDIKNAAIMTKASIKGPVRGYLDGRMRDNPMEALLSFQRDKRFKGIFSIEEEAEIIKDINNAIKGLKPEVEMGALFLQGAASDEFIDLWIANDPRKYREAKQKAIENRTITEQSRRFYDAGMKRSLTKEWLSLPRNLKTSATIHNNIKDLKNALGKGMPVMLRDLLNLKNLIIQEQGLTLEKQTAINYLSLLQVPTREKINKIGEGASVGEPFFGPRRLGEVDLKPRWDIIIPGLDLKTGKFVLNRIDSRIPESFIEMSDILGNVWSYMSGFDFRNKISSTVEGMESVERHVKALNLPEEQSKEITAEMTELYLSEVVRWQNENINEDIGMEDVNKILENMIPQTAFLESVGGIPPDGLDFIMGGRKVTMFPGGKIRLR